MDVKNILELIELGRVSGVVVGEMLEDGKIGLFDLPKLAKLIGPAKDAFEGLANLLPEAKDIDAEEAKKIFEAVVALAAAWTPVFTKAA